MPDIIFQEEAKADLKDIYFYTLDKWGEQQADRYLNQLDDFLLNAANKTAVVTRPLQEFPNVEAIRCQHHVIFFLKHDKEIRVIAVYHERMNLIARIIDRLTPMGN